VKLLKPFIRAALVLGSLTLFPHVSFSSWVTLLLAAVVFEILFSVVRPILKLLFLPINVVTLGLFSAFINIFLLWLVTYLVPGFHIGNLVLFGVELNQFFSLIVTGFLISILQSLVGIFI
jgi:putative membrane protein